MDWRLTTQYSGSIQAKLGMFKRGASMPAQDERYDRVVRVRTPMASHTVTQRLGVNGQIVETRSNQMIAVNGAGITPVICVKNGLDETIVIPSPTDHFPSAKKI